MTFILIILRVVFECQQGKEDDDYESHCTTDSDDMEMNAEEGQD